MYHREQDSVASASVQLFPMCNNQWPYRSSLRTSGSARYVQFLLQLGRCSQELMLTASASPWIGPGVGEMLLSETCIVAEGTLQPWRARIYCWMICVRFGETRHCQMSACLLGGEGSSPSYLPVGIDTLG